MRRLPRRCPRSRSLCARAGRVVDCRWPTTARHAYQGAVSPPAAASSRLGDTEGPPQRGWKRRVEISRNADFALPATRPPATRRLDGDETRARHAELGDDDFSAGCGLFNERRELRLGFVEIQDLRHYWIVAST